MSTWSHWGIWRRPLWGTCCRAWMASWIAMSTWPLWGWMAIRKIWCHMTRATLLNDDIDGQIWIPTRTWSNMPLCPEGLLKPWGIMSKMKSSGKYIYLYSEYSMKLRQLLPCPVGHLNECIAMSGWPPEGLYRHVRMATWRNVSLCSARHLQECIAKFGWPREGMCHYFLMASWRNVSLFRIPPEGFIAIPDTTWRNVSLFWIPPEGMYHYLLMALGGMYHYFLMASCRNVSLFSDGFLQECITIFWWPPEGMCHYFLMASWRNVSLFSDGLLQECVTISWWPPKGMCHYFMITSWRNVSLYPDGLLKECVTISWWPPEGMCHYFL